MFAGGEDGQKMLILTPSPKGELLEGAYFTYFPGGSPNASSSRQYLRKGQYPEEPLSKLRSQGTHLTLVKKRPTAHTVPWGAVASVSFTEGERLQEASKGASWIPRVM